MKISELLSESVDLNTTLNSIASEIGNNLTLIYDRLESAALTYFERTGSLLGFPFIQGSVGAIWRHQSYHNFMQELHHLNRYAPKQTVQLRAFLDEAPTSFNTISHALPPILVKVGIALGHERLVRNARAWTQQQLKFDNLKRELGDKSPKQAKAGVSGIKNKEPEKPIEQPKSTRAATIAGQNVQVDKLVSDILSKLPGSVAGDIRNAISRSDNKLMALQQELHKRKITL